MLLPIRGPSGELLRGGPTGLNGIVWQPRAAVSSGPLPSIRLGRKVGPLKLMLLLLQLLLLLQKVPQLLLLLQELLLLLLQGLLLHELLAHRRQ